MTINRTRWSLNSSRIKFFKYGAFKISKISITQHCCPILPSTDPLQRPTKRDQRKRFTIVCVQKFYTEHSAVFRAKSNDGQQRTPNDNVFIVERSASNSFANFRSSKENDWTRCKIDRMLCFCWEYSVTSDSFWQRDGSRWRI